MVHRISFLLTALLWFAAAFMPLHADRQAADNGEVLLDFLNYQAADDLSVMLERRVIRVLVAYNQTNFFFSGKRAHGFEYELLQAYAEFINRGIGKDEPPIRLVFISRPFEKLLPELLAGRGDMVAAGMTVTPARQRQVDFTEPYIRNVREIVVTHRGVTGLERVEDLAGRKVYVLNGSSYAEHLHELDRVFTAQGLAAIQVEPMDLHLMTEDILELLNAGVIDVMVADEHIAKLWAMVLPDIVLHPDLEINQGGQIAWAVRPGNPELRASLDAFIRDHKQGTLIGNILFKRYYENTRWLKNPLAPKERKKLLKLVDLFQKYGAQYGFDWAMIGAQAYQESRLDHSSRSSAGAIGVMQLLPSTAVDPKIGIPNIERLEDNIHAGVKYLDFLRRHYFSDSEISSEDRIHFAHAAYNAGPTKIQRLRRIAAKRGLDPNRWFFHVEQIALEKIGRETVRYVANIHKYYVAYKLMPDLIEELKQDIDLSSPGSSSRVEHRVSHMQTTPAVHREDLAADIRCIQG